MEWTASDGRKGKLTGTGKPRLTSASLAKVPSEQRSTKELLGAKSTSKKAASSKPAAAGEDQWGAKGDWDNAPAKDGSKKSSSNKGDEWVVDNKSNGDNAFLASTWANNGDAPSGDDKIGGTKNLTTDERQAAIGPVDAASNNNPPVTRDNKEKQKRNDNPHGFTKEQDEEMLKWKAENENKPWADFAEHVGKQGHQCKDRFKQINSKDGNLNVSKRGGGGKEGEGKKRKNKGNNANHSQNQNNGGKKEDEEGEDVNKGNSEAGNLWGALGECFTADIDDGKNDNANKAKDGGNTGGGDSNWNNGAGTGGDIGDSWGPTAGVGAATATWDTVNNQSNNNGGEISQGFNSQTWPTAPKPASKPPSTKAPSRSRPQHKASDENVQPTTARPLELEVKPDDTFSADDLRLVARILQQDCSMVWNRVSWRFRDKTGRTLHPDEFEKKITGRLEGKDDDKAERMR
jgi:hypothetical protein